MRRLVLFGLAVMLALAALPWSPSSARAATPPATLYEVVDRVYFEQTGHHVSGAFLEYWHRNGGLDIFGFPLTEEMDVGGLRVQYFERARFEYHPNNPDHFKVLLGRLGSDLTAGRNEPAFKRMPEDFRYQDNKDHRYFPQTGHFLSHGFKTYWEQNGGLYVFGYPISEEFEEVSPTDGKTYIVQYFERARFEYHPEHRGTRYEVQLGLLGAETARKQGVNTARVAREAGVRVWPDMLTLPDKWIEVNLAIPQLLSAWEGGRIVYQTYISGGTAQNPTPTGVFSVQWKLRYDDMTGGRAGTEEYYYLPDVPHVMYFYTGGYAIHGTYWHTNFGYPMSHGCVNLSQAAAEWVYNWAPTGTKIWIHH